MVDCGDNKETVTEVELNGKADVTAVDCIGTLSTLILPSSVTAHYKHSFALLFINQSYSKYINTQ